MEMLLNAGANAKEKNFDGLTCLEVAQNGRYVEVLSPLEDFSIEEW